MKKVLIIGGVAGGATAAARLRRLDEHLEIIMFERGEHISFANCGLPYYIGGVIEDRRSLLQQTPQGFKKRFNIDVRIYSEVLSIDREMKILKVRDLLSDGEYTEGYDYLVLSPGAVPVKAPIPGADSDKVFVLRNLADTDLIKSYARKAATGSAVVVGGGPVGMEMAENLKRMGLEVSVVELSDQLMSPLDFDMACELHHYIRDMGIDLFLNTAVTEITELPEGLAIRIESRRKADKRSDSVAATDANYRTDVRVVKNGDSGAGGVISGANIDHVADGVSIANPNARAGFITENADVGADGVAAAGAVIKADMLIMAIGVKPESRLAKESGLAVDERGGIAVDEHMRTSDENIYAVGDAVVVTDFVTGIKNMIPLAGPANKQGRIAADNICGISTKYAGTQGSSVLQIFDMTAAATGVNEKTAKRLGLNYDKVFTRPMGHAGYYPGSRNMTLKVLFEKTSGRILGAQIVGFDGVDKRCDVLATAIRAGMNAADLTELELCYAPPYSSAKDPVNMAGYVIENILSGKVKNYHWHDIDSLPKDGSVTLLDVRPARDHSLNSLEGFNNIPLDALRGRMEELDRNKPVYVLCFVGMTSYIACRILSQNGFNAYNLSGGITLYQSVTKND